MIKIPLISGLIAILLCVIFAGDLSAQTQTYPYIYPYEEGELEEQLGESPVVIELFSSQACVFCPMADKFMADLKKRTNLIIMACHVDYFDVRSGSIATPDCSDQQRSYARKIKGATLYTPQVVINGMADYVGYEFDQYVEKAIDHSNEGGVVSLEIEQPEPNNSSRYVLNLKPFQRDGVNVKDLDIIMYMVEEDHQVKVSEGANRGMELPYVNIVRQSQKLGRWDGTAQQVGFTVEKKDSYEAFVILLKNDRDQILGATKVKL